MDVELARPGAFSVDGAIAALGLGLAGAGGYLLLSGVGTRGGLWGWLLVALGWLIVFPRLFLGLRVTDEGVEASVVAGPRTVPLEQVERTRVVEGRLALRPGGLSASGYHTGAFHLDGVGRVQAYASTLAGRFVALERAGEPPVVVSPADPEAFLEALEARAT